ncbi:MAG TPA: type II toxin-antitoxin system PemK/MazF family toxin [Acidimicrobiales bacterium]|nr:type II toxin-antitoxin system PemK/MazF family toxin [Acidimicrobiales bacterium]
MSEERQVGWGEAWWVETETAGRRPAVVLTRPQALPRLPVVLVAPATTRVRGLPSEVMLDETDGIPRKCVLSLDTPELVSRARLVEYITTLSDARMHEICRALNVAVNC